MLNLGVILRNATEDSDKFFDSVAYAKGTPYFKVSIRYYIHFNETKLKVPVWNGITALPYLKEITVAPLTLSMQYKHYISPEVLSKYKCNIDSYIRNKILKRISSNFWVEDKKEFINRYLDRVNKEFDINIQACDEGMLDFNEQICYDIEISSLKGILGSIANT